MNNIQYPLEGSSGWGDAVNSNFHAFEDGIDDLNLNKTEILNTIGDEAMGTTATTLKGAIAEVKGIADSNTTQLNEITNKRNILTYTSLEQLGLTSSATIQAVIKALPDNSTFISSVNDDIMVTILAQCPVGYGTLIIEKRSNSRTFVRFITASNGRPTPEINHIYYCNYDINLDNISLWKQIDTEMVKLFSGSNITTSGTITLSDYVTNYQKLYVNFGRVGGGKNTTLELIPYADGPTPIIVSNSEMISYLVVNGVLCIFYLKVDATDGHKVYYELRDINNTLIATNPNSQQMDLRNIFGIRK